MESDAEKSSRDQIGLKHTKGHDPVYKLFKGTWTRENSLSLTEWPYIRAGVAFEGDHLPRLYNFFFIFIVWGASSSQATPLENFCAQAEGEMFDGLIPCPINKKVENGRFCIFSRKPLVYSDGCSTGEAGLGFSDKFLPACVAHDLCYHSEPQTTGLSRKTCDLNFYTYLKHICRTKEGDSRQCLSAAWSYFKAVRVGGKKNYDCANEQYDYSKIFGFDFLKQKINKN